MDYKIVPTLDDLIVDLCQNGEKDREVTNLENVNESGQQKLSPMEVMKMSQTLPKLKGEGD